MIKNVTLSKWPIDKVDNSFFYKEAIKKVVDGHLGKISTITMTISKVHIGHVFYKFGKDVEIKDLGDARCEVSLRTSVDGFIPWATMCADDVEVLAPEEVRRGVIEKIKKNRYGV